MAGKPIATLGSMHVCPMCTGTVPHVGGPIIGPGASNVLINGKPAALVGDMCTCVGPADVIVQGNPFVKINGKAVVCVGDMTAHGGVITIGEGTVTINSATPEPSVSLPLKEINFPKVSTANKVISKISGKGNQLKEAKAAQDQIKKDSLEHGYLEDFSFSV